MDEQKQNKIAEIKQALLSDASPSGLSELLKELDTSAEERMEGRELCLRSLAKNPQNHVIRLQLARLYYQDELYEFCIRELLELKRATNIDSINRLLEAFGDHVTKYLPTEQSLHGASASLASHAPTSDKHGGQTSVEEGEDSSVFAELDIETDFLEAVERLKEKI